MTDFERAVKKTCVLVSGQEDVLRSRAIGALFEAAGIASDDFDVQTFDAASSELSAWVGAAQTTPFLSERRVVVVRQLLQKDAPKASDNPFGNLPPSALMMLVADPVGGGEERQTKSRSSGAAWLKLVTAANGAVLNYDPDPKKSRQMVKSEAQSRGVAISEKALDTLVEMTGGSLSRSIEEFDKLSLFVGPTLTISERHVEAIVIPSREWNVFKLTDAVFDGSPAQALRQLRTMVDSSSKVETAAFAQILPQISRLVKLVWQARVAIELKSSLSSPAPEFLRTLPGKPNLCQVSPYQQTKIMGHARKTTIPALTRALELISDTDAKIKGSLPSFSSIDSLEMMVFDLIATFRS